MSRSLLDRRTHDTVSQLQHQISSLRRQVAHMSKDASRQGRHAADDFSDVAADFLDDALVYGRDAADVVARRATSLGKAVQRDPLPTMVALGTLALVTSIILSRVGR